MTPCAATKPDGSACKGRPRTGATLCRFHSPEMAQARSDAARLGGTKSGKARLEQTERLDAPDVPLESERDVLVLMKRAINEVLRGKLDAFAARTVGALASVTLKALEQHRAAAQEAPAAADDPLKGLSVAELMKLATGANEPAPTDGH